MKVLMTADTVGGVWTYALELAARSRRTASRWRWRPWGAARRTSAAAARPLPNAASVREPFGWNGWRTPGAT